MRQTLNAMFAGLCLALLAVSMPAPGPASAAEQNPVVFAAASMKDALDSVNLAWEHASGHKASISYAASSALAKQIAQGAPADIFISANVEWMDFLAKQKLIKPDTRIDLLANKLVLIAPSDSKAQIAIGKGFPLAKLLGKDKLAMASVDAVPAGIYGKAALQSLGVWDSVKDNVAQAQNVRAALALVARGEAPFGIVYRTDAIAEPKVKIVDIFPEDSHPPIIYPVAELAGSNNKQADAFFAFLKSDQAKKLIEAQGFTVLPAQAKQAVQP
jgi:molybdate transport system substrate-binding protein